MQGNDGLEQNFDEPWHAELFAITHTLASAGHFAWPDWSTQFSAALKSANDSGDPKDGSNYYDIWLIAFEDFLVIHNLADPGRLAELKCAWTDAYLATPHGMPVQLGRPNVIKKSVSANR